MMRMRHLKLRYRSALVGLCLAVHMPLVPSHATGQLPRRAVESRDQDSPSRTAFDGRSTDGSSAGLIADWIDQQQASKVSAEQPHPYGKPFQPSRVLARVGGHPIFVGDIIPEANQLVERFLADAPAEIKQRERDKLVLRLVPKYIDNKLLWVDAVRSLPEQANIDDVLEKAGKQFDQHIVPQMLQRSNMASTMELDAQLRAIGSSLRRARDQWVETEFVKFMVVSKLDIEPEVTHQEMLRYYRMNLDDFAVPARARWHQLTVRNDRFPSRAEARRAIAEMGNEIVYGASFEAVARARSHGLNAPKGGFHDWTAKGSLASQKLEAVIFSIPLGMLSDIIETEEGFHIVRVMERSEAGHVPFGEAQVEIRNKIAEEKRDEAVQSHLARLRREIPIDVVDPEAQEMVAQAEAERLRR